ncbi:uncharacterized protein CPUR_04250 [Claviceps purpurea 20.1]|uniref:SMP domain-containing protein n=1 Tax=Claviceps purpurea (strain 20.1) TaxID=1111077 RepID=M1VVZ9_CLAP2|nr:hypothetical protein E4U51_004496 [Claviceps purpurea]CCE30402.1 uncharacterized protein CPUR_04250 [Claviceps purpurea 20.1]
MPPKQTMAKEDASRIQSSQAKSGANMTPGDFTARVQSAGDRNENAKDENAQPKLGDFSHTIRRVN